MNFARLTATVCTIFIFFTLPACSDADKKKDKHYLRALEYIKIDDDKSAVLELKNAIQLDAKFADARYQLGLIYLKEGNPRAAFGELQRAAGLDPKNLDAGVKVAEFFLLSRNKEESRKYVEQVLNEDPTYQDGLALISNLELIEGNFDKAAKAINDALSQDGENDKYFNIRGRILVAQGKAEEGKSDFLRAIQLGPDSFANYRTLLLFYQQHEDEEAVAQLLDDMTRQFPENPQLYIMLSQLHRRNGDIEAAEKALLRAQETSKDTVSPNLMLAEFYKDTRNYSKAEETLLKARIEFPETIQVQITLGELFFDLQKFEEAKKIMDTILEPNPANGGANLLRARFLIRDQKPEEAIEILASLMSDYPKWGDLFYYSALCHLRIGKIELAQKAIELALQNNRSKDRYHALAAQIHLIRGNSSEATKEAAIALRINSHNFVAIKILTKSLIQNKDFQKAIDLLDRINQETVTNDVELLGSLAMAQLGLDQKDKAEQTFTRLLALEPQNSKTLAILTALQSGNDISNAIEFVTTHNNQNESWGHYLLLGDLLIKDRQFQEALAAFQNALRLNPNNPRGYIVKAQLLNRLGKAEESMATYEELLIKRPKSIPALMGLATILEQQGKPSLAKEKYIVAMEIQPDLPVAANNLAWLLASEEGADLGEALRLAMQAKQALSDQPHIADTLGWVHYKRKSYPLAITQFKQALEKRPDNPTINYHLALAQAANDSKEEAITSIEKSLNSGEKFGDREAAKLLLEELRGN